MISFDCAALLEHSILLLAVVICCVLQRVGPILGIIGAPYRNVGTTLSWIIVTSVIWYTGAGKMSLRAYHCGRESLVAHEKSCQLRHMERLYRI